MAVEWDANIAADAIKEWAKKEVADTTDRLEAFLKFFFGISLSSVAAYVAILKLYHGENVVVDVYFFAAIICFILSMLVIITSALREKGNFGENTDLHAEYEKDFEFYVSRMWIWFCFWIVALVFSGVSLLHN